MVLPVNYGSCENLVRATIHDCAVLEYIFQDFVCVRFAFIMMNSMRRMEKKGCFCARKKERKKHHHFSSLKANKFNAAEILNSNLQWRIYFRIVSIQARETRVWEQPNDSVNIILLYPPCDDT